ncbi:MAG: hypothetical protein MJH08_17770 [Hyphomicrobiales bacterium]|nr:hypothetical protein [Hyphomicrobiales bacterium]
MLIVSGLCHAKRVFALLAFAFTAALALSFPAKAAELKTPIDGASWEMRYRDVGNKIKHYGTVTYKDNRYHMKLTGREFDGQYFHLPRSVNAELVSEEVTSHNRIVFKIPKIEVRNLLVIPHMPDEAFADSRPAGIPADVLWSLESSQDEAEAAIPEPSFKSGTYIDGVLSPNGFTEEMRKELLSRSAASIQNFASVFDKNGTSGSFYGRGVTKPDQLVVPLRWRAWWTETKGSGFINKEVVVERQTPVTVLRATMSPGFELVLEKSRVDDNDTSYIRWSWSMTASDHFKTRQAKGGGGAPLKPIEFSNAPEVIATFVAQDQLARTTPNKKRAIFPYPFDKDGKAVKGVITTRDFPDRRHLFVLGRNLIVDAEKRDYVHTKFFNQDEGVKYIGFSNMHKGLSGLKQFVEEHQPENAAEGLVEEILAKADSLGEDADILQLTIVLKPKIVAGEKSVTLFRQKVNWPLQFGDNGLILRFVRSGLSPKLQVSGRTLAVGKKGGASSEEARHLVMRDKIEIEARIEGAQQLEELEVALLSKASGHMKVSDRLGLIKLRPVKGEEKVLRSKTFIVANRASLDESKWEQLPEAKEENSEYIPKEKALALRPDTRLRLALMPNEHNFFQRRYIGDTVTVTIDETRVHGKFIDALKRSYKCSGIKINDWSWEEMTTEKQDQASSYAFGLALARGNPFLTLKTDITHGEHAALLMVRDLFVKKLRHVRDTNAKMRTNKKVLLAYFNRWQRRSVDPEAPQSILTEKLDVPGLGTPRSFEHWLDNAAKLTELQKVYVASISIERQISYMDKALKTVGAALECDSPSLLSYFGSGADQLIDEIVPTLMRRELNDGVWIVRPDWIARQIFGSLRNVKYQVDANAGIAERDTNMIKACLFVASAPFGFGIPAVYGIVTGAEVATGAGLAALAFAADATDAAITVARNINTHMENDALLEFARGASPVLGESLLLDAEAGQTSKALLAFDTMMSLVGTANSLVDFAGVARQAPIDAPQWRRWYVDLTEMSPRQLNSSRLAGSQWAQEIIELADNGNPAMLDNMLPFALRDMKSDQARNVAAFVASTPEQLTDPAMAALHKKFLESMDSAKNHMESQMNVFKGKGMLSKLGNKLGDLSDAKEGGLMDLPFDTLSTEYGVYDNKDGLFPGPVDEPEINLPQILTPEFVLPEIAVPQLAPEGN